MFKKFITTSLFLFLFFSQPGLIAQTDNGPQVIKLDGKDYTLHKITAGETLYSISKQYHVEMGELVMVNRIGSEGYSIGVGEVLIIPLYSKKETVAEVPKTPDGYLTHIVKPGETLYSISRSYNGVTLDMIKAKNNLTSDTVKVNQKLLIPQDITAEVKVEDITPEPERDDSVTENVEKAITRADVPARNDQADFDWNNLDESNVEVSRGVGTWLDNDRLESSNTFYALHKYAPIGTTIKVRNLMNNRVVYVKVIGKLPDNDENRSIVIKLSAGAARFLNVLDKKFLVELMIPHEKS